MSTEIIHKELSYKVNGIIFSVHNTLGRFCSEKQYCDALEQKLIENKIPYVREFVLPPSFDNEQPGRNRVDFIIENKIILEIKAKQFIEKPEYFQIMRYLKATNLKLGLLINFRTKYVHPKRIINPYN